MCAIFTPFSPFSTSMSMEVLHCFGALAVSLKSPTSGSCLYEKPIHPEAEAQMR